MRIFSQSWEAWEIARMQSKDYGNPQINCNKVGSESLSLSLAAQSKLMEINVLLW